MRGGSSGKVLNVTIAENKGYWNPKNILKGDQKGETPD